jgi:hypothetical protein
VATPFTALLAPLTSRVLLPTGRCGRQAARQPPRQRHPRPAVQWLARAEGHPLYQVSAGAGCDSPLHGRAACFVCPACAQTLPDDTQPTAWSCGGPTVPHVRRTFDVRTMSTRTSPDAHRRRCNAGTIVFAANLVGSKQAVILELTTVGEWQQQPLGRVLGRPGAPGGYVNMGCGREQ